MVLQLQLLVQQCWYCAESAAKTKHRLSRHRDAVQIWAASAVSLGLILALWSAVALINQMPEQDAPLAEVSESASPTSPSNSSLPGQSPSASVPPETTALAQPLEPVLYPNRPKIGSKIGTISLPSLKLNWPIYEGTAEAQLSKGVGHYRGSVLPGAIDNAVLSGHRTTVFNRLGELKKGDLITVKTSAGYFTYKVRAFKVVKRTDRTVIVPTETAVLTLTTCYPFNNIGATTKAYIVSADLLRSNLTKP